MLVLSFRGHPAPASTVGLARTLGRTKLTPFDVTTVKPKLNSWRQRLLGRVPPAVAAATGIGTAVLLMFAAGSLLPSSKEIEKSCQASCVPRIGEMVSTLPQSMTGKPTPKVCECR